MKYQPEASDATPPPRRQRHDHTPEVWSSVSNDEGAAASIGEAARAALVSGLRVSLAFGPLRRLRTSPSKGDTRADT